jgi:hypothetical protein
MALDPAVLSEGLLALYYSKPQSIPAAAQGLAGAYTAYASAGMFLGGALAPLDAQSALLEQALLIAMTLKGPSSLFAAAWSQGLTAFWLGAAVVGPNTGTTLGCPGAPSVVGPLLESLEGMPLSMAQSASEFAAALHTATATVTATVTLPAPPFTTVTPIL